jgi:hypothetical protein
VFWDRLLFSSLSIRVALATMAAGTALATARVTAAEPDFAAAHADAVAANPPGVSCAIGLVAQQARFRVGELIPLDLVYAFDESDTYLINDDLARGSGTARLLEVFRVWPREGTYRRTGDEPNSSRWAGGTPRGAKGDRVYRYRVYLNEWRRFDRPGKYRFYCTGSRVWKAGEDRSRGNNTLRLTSNLLELEILPAAARWQHEQVRTAVRVLDHADADTREHRAARREALRRLRYLATEAAIRELARRYPGRNDGEKYDIEMGIHESRYNAAAAEELERRLDHPDFVVTKEYLRHLAYVAAEAQHPTVSSDSRGDQLSREEQDRHWKEHCDLEEDLCAAYFASAWTAAELKEPVVRARSLFELFQFTGYSSLHDRRLLTPERMARIRAAVLSEFEQLPAEDQLGLLKSCWRRFGGVDFLPALRRYIAVAPERGEYDRFGLPIDFAFRRFVQLAPDEGRKLFMAELRRVRPRCTLTSVNLLPDGPIPELGDALATQLEEGIDDLGDAELATALVARYGSAAIYDRVREVYGDKGGYWACSLQDAMLAYFMRHNPEEGRELVNQALDAREHTGCYSSTLSDIAEIHMTAALEKIAVERLDDKELDVVENALRTLRRFGSAAAEQPLWRKFERWHATWKSRVAELTDDGPVLQTDSPVYIERSLIRALAEGESWMADPPKLKRLRALSLTRRGRAQVDRLLDKWREPIAISFNSGSQSEFPSARERIYRGRPDNDYWYVAQYSAESLAGLKKLLARFPKGTTFSFPTGMLTDAEAEQRLFRELQQHVAAHGLELVRAPPPR